MKTILALAVTSMGILFVTGCASTSKHDPASLQGSWVGHEIEGSPGECRMTITGDTLKFQGARQEEWYAAKLTLFPTTTPKQADVLIQDCSAPQYVNKTAKAIYRIEGKTMTIAANEPGDDARPMGFERTNRSRVFVFERP